MFNIGYAEEIFYASKMNIYPANTTRISENINSGTLTGNGPYAGMSEKLLFLK